jgi:hypothetical protein
MNEKYVLRDEPGKTMFVFEENGKYYGHIVKERTDKSPAKSHLRHQSTIR